MRINVISDSVGVSAGIACSTNYLLPYLLAYLSDYVRNGPRRQIKMLLEWTLNQ